MGGDVRAPDRRHPVATLDVLDPALIDRFSVEGYRGGTGYFDDAYVRRYATLSPPWRWGRRSFHRSNCRPRAGC